MLQSVDGCVCFFFQAEDGIRDYKVTGVQTCALPISALEQQIQAAIKSVKSQGFCAASWQPEVVALATPLVTPDAIYVLNCSVSTTEPLPTIVQELHPALLQLGRQIESLLEKL